MNHTELQAAVSDLLHMTGWEFLHVRKSIGRRSGGRGWQTTTNLSGWPDLAPCWSHRQPGRVLAIELKVPPDKLSTEQVTVSESLTAAGFEFYVIRPDDLERLAAILARRTKGG